MMWNASGFILWMSVYVQVHTCVCIISQSCVHLFVGMHEHLHVCECCGQKLALGVLFIFLPASF